MTRLKLHSVQPDRQPSFAVTSCSDPPIGLASRAPKVTTTFSPLPSNSHLPPDFTPAMATATEANALGYNLKVDYVIHYSFGDSGTLSALGSHQKCGW